MSVNATLLDLGDSFLRRLGNQATNGFNKAMRSNPGGGGASESTEAPRFRTWGEAYGISARTSAIGDFVGDRRQTVGGVAGFGMRVAPGVNMGVSVDQSHTAIDVPLALQSARSISPSSASTRRSTRDRGHGRSRPCTASATSIRAATPGLASPAPSMPPASTAC
jgi:uncharacterized protein with beta-barrel porin domain